MMKRLLLFSILLTCSIVNPTAYAQAPLILDPLGDISVQCVEDLPTTANITTQAGCTITQVEQIAALETGRQDSTCQLIAAVYSGESFVDPWAFWLPDLADAGLAPSANWLFDNNVGTLDLFADGSAHLYGTIVNDVDPSLAFEVDVWFENAADWAAWSGQGRSYLDATGFAEDGNLYEDWTYYEMIDVCSQLRGIDGMAGNDLALYHKPASNFFGFQCGVGANNKNPNYGMSGWFTFVGTVNGQAVEGQGDINVDKSCSPTPQPTCPNDTEFTVFWEFEDNCGNTGCVTQTVTVEDDTAPSIPNFPDDATVNCEDWPTAVPTLNAVDNCDAGNESVDITYLGEFLISGTTNCNRVYERRWRTRDCHNNVQIFTQTINLVDNSDPIFTFIPKDTSYTCGQTVLRPIPTAIDNCGDVNITTTEERTDGVCADNYTILRRFTATDECGNVTLAQQEITVADDEVPVFAPYDPNTEVACENYDNFPDLTATDNCGSVTIVKEEELMSGGCLGGYFRRFIATDECGNQTVAEQYVALIDNEPPTINNPADRTIECSDAIPTPPNVSITDNCGEFVSEFRTETIGSPSDCSYQILWIWKAKDQCYNEVEVTTTITIEDNTPPVWGNFDPFIDIDCSELDNLEDCEATTPPIFDECTNVTTFCETEVASGGCLDNRVRRYWAQDACGNLSDTIEQIIRVDDNIAPQITNFPPDEVLECTSGIQISTVSDLETQINFTDDCTVVTLNFVGETTTQGCPGEQVIERCWNVQDACGNTSGERCHTITVRDTTDPVFDCVAAGNCPQNETLSCNQFPAQVTLTASDSCDPNVTVTMTADTTDITSECDLTITRTYVARDDCGNSTNYSYQITLKSDNTPPVWGTFAPFIDIECDETIADCEATMPSITDNCENCPVETFCEEEVASGGCLENMIRRYWAVDACGNPSDTIEQIIRVDDNIAPQITNFPPDEVLECTSGIQISTVSDLETQINFTDDCTVVTLNFVGETTTQGCPGEQVIERCWNVQDACGNTSGERCHTITVRDTTDPVFDCVAAGNCPQNETLSCNQFPAQVTLTASDSCDPNVTVTMTADTTDITSECDLTITRTYVARDDCGNSTNYSYQITLKSDNTPPVWGTFAPFIDIECDETIADCEATMPSITDNCENCPVETFCEEEVASGGCLENMIRRYWARDACGNLSDTIEQIVRVDDNTPPQFANFPADVNRECSAPNIPTRAELEAQISFTDDCTAVTLNFLGEEITGNCPQEQIIERCWNLEDACGNVSGQRCHTTTIRDTTDPVFDCVAAGNCPQNETLSCNQFPAQVILTASDNCDPNVTVTMTADTTDITSECDLTITRTYVARDDCGNTTSRSYQITLKSDNTPPVWGTFAPFIDVECDESIATCEQTMPSITDNCENCPVETFCEEEVASGGCLENVIRRYWAVDACGNPSDTIEQIVRVDDNLPPQFANFPANINRSCAAALPTRAELEAQITFTDDCTSVTLNFLGETVTPGDCPQEQTIERCWNLEDACGNVSGQRCHTVTTNDTVDPVFDCIAAGNCPQNETLSCNQFPAQVILTASDNCDPNVTVTMTADTTDITSECDLTITRTYVARDDCGNAETFSYQITLKSDNTPPVWGAFNPIIEIECDETVAACEQTLPSITDNCENCPVETFCEEEVASGGCLENVIRRYWAVDACGNPSDTIEQIVRVDDNVAPQFTAFPTDDLVECSANGTSIPTRAELEAQISFTDDCTTVTLNFLGETTTPGDCPGEETIQRCWTVEDACGNVSGQRCHRVRTQDTQAPVFDCIAAGNCPNTVTVECDQPIPDPVTLTASDACDPNVTVTVSTAQDNQTCPLTVTYTYTATDDCGRSTTYVYRVIQDDTTPPVVTILGGTNITIECDDPVPAANSTVTDNCTPSNQMDVNVTETTNVPDPDCPSCYTLIRVYRVTDACGNVSASRTQTITVEDNEAPDFVSPIPQDMVIDCDEEFPDAPVVNATDNCDDDVTIILEETFVGDAPLPGAATSCRLRQPSQSIANCYPQDVPAWSMILPGFVNDYLYYTLVEGTFTEFNNGSAQINATLQSVDNPNGRWELELFFERGYSWNEWQALSFDNGFKDDCEFVNNTNDLNEAWTYYLFDTNQPSTLTGQGDFAGSLFTLEQAPDNLFFGYQVGDAANNVNFGFGSGGWFFYEGNFVENSSNTNIQVARDLGDFAFEHNCCPEYGVIREWCATDCKGNETCIQQTVVYEGFDINAPPPVAADGSNNTGRIIKEISEELAVQLFPNPNNGVFYIHASTSVEPDVIVNVYDYLGRLVKTQTIGQDLIDVMVMIDLQDMDSGMYLVEMISKGQKKVEQVFIHQ